jgi:DNA-binding transcriptional MerR regulator
MEIDDETWRTHRQLQAQIKNLGLPIEDIKSLLAEYEASTQRLAAHRNKQFASVIQQVREAKSDEAIGAVLRAFAEHVVNEARITGIRARDTTESIVDQVPDLTEQESETR